jgi:ABC-type transport system involved in multi-copper enzyme maturation permease subunit
VVVGAVAVFVSFVAGQALLATQGLAVGIGEPGVLRALVGSVLYLGAAALFGLGVGLVVRNTGGGITAAIVGLIILPSLGALLPGRVGDTVARFITSNAGRQVTFVEPAANGLAPWVGYAVFVAWGVALLVAGTVLLRRRDA